MGVEEFYKYLPDHFLNLNVIAELWIGLLLACDVPGSVEDCNICRGHHATIISAVWLVCIIIVFPICAHALATGSAEASIDLVSLRFEGIPISILTYDLANAFSQAQATPSVFTQQSGLTTTSATASSPGLSAFAQTTPTSLSASAYYATDDLGFTGVNARSSASITIHFTALGTGNLVTYVNYQAEANRFLDGAVFSTPFSVVSSNPGAAAYMGYSVGQVLSPYVESRNGFLGIVTPYNAGDMGTITIGVEADAGFLRYQIPEPSTWVLLMTGLGFALWPSRYSGLAARHRRGWRLIQAAAMLVVLLAGLPVSASAEAVDVSGEWFSSAMGHGVSLSGSWGGGFFGDDGGHPVGVSDGQVGFGDFLSPGGNAGSVTIHGVTYEANRSCAINPFAFPCAHGSLSIFGSRPMPVGLVVGEVVTFSVVVSGQITGCLTDFVTCQTVSFTADGTAVVSAGVNAVGVATLDTRYPTITFAAMSQVPEPSTWLLLVSGVIALFVGRVALKKLVRICTLLWMLFFIPILVGPVQAEIIPLTSGGASATLGLVTLYLQGGPASIIVGEGSLSMTPDPLQLRPGAIGSFHIQGGGSSPCCTVGGFSDGLLLETVGHPVSFFAESFGTFIIPNLNVPLLTFTAASTLDGQGSGTSAVTGLPVYAQLAGTGTATFTLRRNDFRLPDVSYTLSSLFVSVDAPATVPEPSTWILMAGGIIGLVLHHRCMKRHPEQCG